MLVKTNRVVFFFVYIRGGAKPADPPRLVLVTWAGYKGMSILFSTGIAASPMARPLHICISDVSFKLAGSDKRVDEVI